MAFLGVVMGCLGDVDGVEAVCSATGLLLAILFGVDVLDMSSSGAGRFLEGDIGNTNSAMDIDMLFG